MTYSHSELAMMLFSKLSTIDVSLRASEGLAFAYNQQIDEDENSQFMRCTEGGYKIFLI